MNPSNSEGFSASQRLRILSMSVLGWTLVRTLGGSSRYRVEDWDNFQQFKDRKQAIIYSFWHNQILSATYFWRFREIVVITSQHFDGEYIARIIERFGYGTARGSSTRGGVRALIEMKNHLAKGRDVAFTIDGPRGPVYRVKPGPLWLSQKTGAPIIPFHIEPKNYWTLKSWDSFRIPKPFTPALVKIGRPLVVPEGASEEQWLDLYQAEMDRLTNYCRSFWKASNPQGVV